MIIASQAHIVTRPIVHSFNALFENHHPEFDYLGDAWPDGSLGQQLAGKTINQNGYFAVVHRITGDGEFSNKHLGLPHPHALEPCCFCFGNRSTMPFLDLTIHARWRQSVKKPPQRWPSDHPVWGIIGVTLFTVVIDWMHSHDLGVMRMFIGSVLTTIVFQQLVGQGSPAERCAKLWVEIQAIYKDLCIQKRINTLSLSMFCDPNSWKSDYPEISTKASETKHFVQVVLELCRRYRIPGDECSNHRFQAALHFTRVGNLLDSCGYIPSKENANLIESEMNSAMAHYQWLANDAASKGFCLWTMVNKCHWLLHLSEQARFLNPQACWTYPFEDMVGKIQQIAMHSKDGTPGHKIPEHIFQKYRVVLSMRLARRWG